MLKKVVVMKKSKIVVNGIIVKGIAVTLSVLIGLISVCISTNTFGIDQLLWGALIIIFGLVSTFSMSEQVKNWLEAEEGRDD